MQEIHRILINSKTRTRTLEFDYELRNLFSIFSHLSSFYFLISNLFGFVS